MRAPRIGSSMTVDRSKSEKISLAMYRNGIIYYIILFLILYDFISPENLSLLILNRPPVTLFRK